ncbi:hypothetical protein [uncultured Sphingomonas sp.]|uniref:hypothetical protein n=1 Tax=uncultured Sphingomonas sp. TaxID=158754 RepID=UPI0035CAEBF2
MSSDSGRSFQHGPNGRVDRIWLARTRPIKWLEERENRYFATDTALSEPSYSKLPGANALAVDKRQNELEHDVLPCVHHVGCVGDLTVFQDFGKVFTAPLTLSGSDYG